MLDSILSEKGLPALRGLPFVLQMKVASYAPRLFSLAGVFCDVLRLHYETRVCGECGKFLQKLNRTHHCLCRWRRRKFSLDERKRVTYRRPLYIFVEASVTTQRFHYVCYTTKQVVFVSSNQPEFVFSLCRLIDRHDVLSKLCVESYFDIEYLSKTLIEPMINTNTCLRSFVDAFIDSSFEEVVSFTCFQKTVSKNTMVVSKDALQKINNADMSMKEMAHSFMNG